MFRNMVAIAAVLVLLVKVDVTGGLFKIAGQAAPLKLLGEQVAGVLDHQMLADQLLAGIIPVSCDDALQQLLILAHGASKLVQDSNAQVIAAPAEAGHGCRYGGGAELVGESIDIAVDVGHGIPQKLFAVGSDGVVAAAALL